MNDRLVDVWVLYDHPQDHPDYFIVRRQCAHTDGSVTANQTAYGFKDAATARAWLAAKGLTCLARHPDDDPVIMETWI